MYLAHLGTAKYVILYHIIIHNPRKLCQLCSSVRGEQLDRLLPLHRRWIHGGVGVQLES